MSAVLRVTPVRSFKRLPAFLAAYLVFALITLAATVLGEHGSLNRPVYHIILFGVTLWPLFLLRDPLGEHRLFLLFCAIYYMWYGAADYVIYVLWQFGSLSELAIGEWLRFGISEFFRSDLLIVLGIAFFQIGYLLLRKMRGRRRPAKTLHEWRPRPALRVALFIWTIGAFMSVLVWVFELSHAGTWLSHMIANLSYMAFIGSLMVIYLFWQDRRPAGVTPVLIVVICASAMLGLLAGSKNLTFQVIALFILGAFLIKGRFPKAVVVLAAIASLLFVISYTVLYQYRNTVLAGKTGAVEQAAEDISSTFSTVGKSLQKQDLLGDGVALTLNRINQRSIIDMVVGNVGVSVPYLYGESLMLLPYSLIPRALWPGKPGISLGKIANRVFRVSDSDDTYIGVTLIGEFYWNFGFVGAALSMGLLGGLIAWIGIRCAMVPIPTATRFLVLATSTYYLGLRFESGFGTNTHYIRTLVLIWVIGLVMKRLGFTKAVTATGQSPA